jgi:hypothetical protein
LIDYQNYLENKSFCDVNENDYLECENLIDLLNRTNECEVKIDEFFEPEIINKDYELINFNCNVCENERIKSINHKGRRQYLHYFDQKDKSEIEKYLSIRSKFQ